MTSKNSATLSLPKSRTVRGYEIRKMPIGAFLEACSLLEELPGTALRLLFPEKKEGDILAELAGDQLAVEWRREDAARECGSWTTWSLSAYLAARG